MLMNVLKFSNIKLALFTVAVGLYLIGSSTAADAAPLAYFEDNGGDFGTIDLKTGQRTIINPNPALQGGLGLGVFNNILYYTTNNNGYGQLWSINPANGAATFIGASGRNYVAFGSTSNGLFAYVYAGPIVSINPTNGAATDIGTPEGAMFPTLSTSKDSSSLYEINAGTSALNRYFWSINTVNGSYTQLGSSLSSNNWYGAMVLMNGTLYAILQPGINGGAPFETDTINTSTGGTFNNDWTQIPGTIISPPAVVWNSANSSTQMVVQGSGNTIWSSTFNSTGTFNNDWTQISGAIISPPALAWDSVNNKIQMVVQGSGNTIWASTFSSTGTFNNDWTQMPGAIIDRPAIVSDSVLGRLIIVVRGTNNSIWAMAH